MQTRYFRKIYFYR